MRRQLGILVRGNVANDIAELSGGCESTVTAIFKTFVLQFSGHFYTDYVKVPERDRLKKMKEVYRRLPDFFPPELLK